MYYEEGEKNYTLRFDGASKGNPGESGAGAVIFLNGKPIIQAYHYLGSNSTNNQAEYNGLILGLRTALAHDIRVLTIQGDSNLIISQVLGKWKVSNPKLQELYDITMDLIRSSICIVKLEHIYRTDNTIADFLANEAIKTKGDKCWKS